MSEIHESQSIQSNVIGTAKQSEETPIRDEVPLDESGAVPGGSIPSQSLKRESEKPSNLSGSKQMEEIEVVTERSAAQGRISGQPKPPRPSNQFGAGASVNGSVNMGSDEKRKTEIKKRQSNGATSKDSRSHTADGLGMSHHITHRSQKQILAVSSNRVGAQNDAYEQEEFDKEESKRQSSNKVQPSNNSGEKYSSDFHNSRRGSKKPSLPVSVKKGSSRAYSSIGGHGTKDPALESQERLIVEEMQNNKNVMSTIQNDHGIDKKSSMSAPDHPIVVQQHDFTDDRSPLGSVPENTPDDRIAMIEGRMKQKKAPQTHLDFKSSNDRFNHEDFRHHGQPDFISSPGNGNFTLESNFNPGSTGPSTMTYMTEARKPPRKKGGPVAAKKKDKTFVQAAQQHFIKQRQSPTIYRDSQFILSNKFPGGSSNNVENANTNYTSNTGSISSPIGAKMRSSSVQGHSDSRSKGRTCKSRYSHQLLQNYDSLPETSLDPPYVNKIGPGEHSFISTFESNKIYHVNRFHNQPLFTFPQQDYRHMADYRFGQSPTRSPYTSQQAFRIKVDKKLAHVMSLGPGTPQIEMPGGYDPAEHGRNLNQYNQIMMKKAYHSFGGHGKNSPPRLTQTQTFGKEERGAVHLFYDPDFKDENDFRQDLRKQAMSPGPGAHKDPLKSFKYVIPTNGKYSIPKAKRLDFKIRKVWDKPAPDQYKPDEAHKKMVQSQSSKHGFPQARRHIDTRLYAFECTSILEKGCAMHI
ncbi:hypothetical protein FGO68_gene8522 [Halteria grandinella]|uniref:Uncharacterized protein n=1 Tax=Halteria grandinella TaxID=5974 RepID=A0A8J8NY62_HALGN|nr:hypothetical protein FGO68_gene8522 [Halteria grandinella]